MEKEVRKEGDMALDREACRCGGSPTRWKRLTLSDDDRYKLRPLLKNLPPIH